MIWLYVHLHNLQGRMALADYCKESKTIYTHKNISIETNATLKLNFEQLKPG